MARVRCQHKTPLHFGIGDVFGTGPAPKMLQSHSTIRPIWNKSRPGSGTRKLSNGMFSPCPTICPTQTSGLRRASDAIDVKHRQTDITSIEPPITEDCLSNQIVVSNLEVWVPSAHGDGGAQVSPPNRPGGYPKWASRGPRNHNPLPIYN